MSASGEHWLAEGLRYVTDKSCPLCAQSLEGSPIFKVFKSYFSKAYSDFQQELTQLKETVNQPLSDSELLTIQKRLSDNAALSDFWKDYCPDIPHQLSFDERIKPAIRELRKVLDLSLIHI